MKYRLLVIIAFVTGSAQGASPNYTARFFDSAEMQMESKSQCREVRQALNDCLSMSREKFKKQRYRDYQGKPGQWTAAELIQRHFVAAPPTFDEAEFFKTYRSGPAKRSIQAVMKKLGNCRAQAVE